MKFQSTKLFTQLLYIRFGFHNIFDFDPIQKGTVTRKNTVSQTLTKMLTYSRFKDAVIGETLRAVESGNIPNSPRSLSLAVGITAVFAAGDFEGRAPPASPPPPTSWTSLLLVYIAAEVSEIAEAAAAAKDCGSSAGVGERAVFTSRDDSSLCWGCCSTEDWSPISRVWVFVGSPPVTLRRLVSFNAVLLTD